jgi:crossover junction endodeoxyribonuclease RuvC
MAAATPPPVPEPRTVLGVDPGTTVMGYGVVRSRGKEVELVEVGVLHLAKYPDHAVKLKRIHDRISALIEAHMPDHLAVEAPFFGNNVQSMLKLGRAQGVVLAAALARDIPVAEYAPTRIKQAITGAGSASKEQVRAMVARTLNVPLDVFPKELDGSDGVAVALCHHFAASSPRMQRGSGGWKAFLADNPDRIR